MKQLKQNELIDIVNKFENKKVLVIGDVMLDKHTFGSAKRVSPEAPVLVVKSEKEEYAIGGAANLAHNIMSLGGKVSLIGVIGEDNEGKLLINKIKESGINLYHFKDKKRPTTTKTRIIAAHQQVVRIDKEYTDKIDADIEKRIMGLVNKKIKDYDAIVLSDYDKGIFTDNLIKNILNLSKQNNKKVISAPKNNICSFKDSYLICVNRSEAEQITSVPYKNNSKEVLLYTLSSMGEHLSDKTNCEYVVITCGDDGMFSYSRNGKKDFTHTISKEVSDVTGAGDTSLAALTLSIISGADIHDAARIANYAGGLKVQKLGVKTVSRKELENIFTNLNYKNQF